MALVPGIFEIPTIDGVSNSVSPSTEGVSVGGPAVEGGPIMGAVVGTGGAVSAPGPPEAANW